MTDDLVRPDAMYRQLAGRLAEAIAEGKYAPGDLLPSETQLMERYGVSRPTVRSAVAELRSMGLAESQHGRGTVVRSVAVPTTVIDRTVTRTGKRFTVGWEATEAEFPAVTRGHTTGVTAHLLDRDEEAAFIVDRLLTDASGTRATHRVTIPFDVAHEVPELAKAPDTDPAAIYAALTAAGHTLTWTEYVTARSPLPDERAALRMADTGPILVTYRVTATADGRPLILEELHTNAARAQLAFRVTANKSVRSAR
ncbi:GntR family transcriptional regulator [Streptomyces lunaelactis]|uniref:GntR family transcriptional regulator n=1 Tax=Streptomyces lunaelactis TaxID=1535768 RepID=UPI0015851D4F|nr:GntR family transcriptional regulator [Streptomyces lunaelactis]NUK01727.1 GntR family transcriptional regulator [Streptomyces lunaelactis]NUK34570.1 GntR family transcriptional regulator [Streptomyces lunaelactis]NUK42227.1 GntR family transcriptional regulator [Streptomyces lunaelactis]NUK91650.1 GntR family transcriptional regulator [Streptomyces lunaelactis]NUL31112.1 GntR family transcriptional regulator [Streptomyces lunaelactis]